MLLDDKKLLESKELVKKLGRCGHFLYFKMEGYSGRTRVLMSLLKEGELLQKDLQQKLNIKSGSMSDLLIKMESENLIERIKSREDGRNMIIKLTDKGKEESLIKKEVFDKKVVELFDCISREEKDTLDNILEKILNHWEKFEIKGVN